MSEPVELWKAKISLVICLFEGIIKE